MRASVTRALTTLALVALAACRSNAPQPNSGAATTLRPVTLPDLSSATASVQQQLRDRAAAVQQAGTSSTPDPARAKAYGDLGMLLMAAEYYTEAEVALADAETLAPGEMRWPYYLGHLYRTNGQTEKSTAAFERAVKADPSYPPALVWLGNAYLDQGRPDAAQPLFEQALGREPRLVAAVFGLGRVALARKDYATAITQFERALAIDPDASVVHYPLALAYRGAGQPDRAQAHLRPQGTGELKPPDPVYEDVELLLETSVAFELRGARALTQGQWDAAVTNFRKGVALAPNEPALRHKLATALALKGDTAAAIATMRETVRRSPSFAKGHYSLGLLQIQSGAYAEARASFETAIRIEPAYVEARLQLAELLRRSGQASAALPHYTRLMALDPRVAEARFGYAMALVELGRFVEARDQLAQGMQMFPDREGFAFALARVLSASPQAPVRDGQRALAMLQGMPEPQRGVLEYGVVMAMALAETGRFDEAAQWQQQVVDQLAPGTDARLRAGLVTNLRLYQQRRPCRQPWFAAEPMELAAS